jgi:antitoxin (DNA-binding transcriptional repressor) of toxin-antitoxin stability system
MTLLMRDHSDNLINMKKTMTATEVARNFSDVLDAVVAGDEITITRGKRPIAILSEVKAPVPNSIALKAAIQEYYKTSTPGTAEETQQLIDEIRADRDADLALEIERGMWND